MPAPKPEELVAMREERGLSVDQLAAQAELSPNTIYKYEGGKTKRLHPSTWRKIAQVLVTIEPTPKIST